MHARQFLGNLNSRDRPRCLTWPEISHSAYVIKDIKYVII